MLDEITMAHKGGVEVLNRSLNDIRVSKMLMGGVTFRDFRYTLSVEATKRDQN